MAIGREELHRLVDSLPEDAVLRAQAMLEQCRVPPPETGSRGVAVRIEHSAAWVSDLARARVFYERWFEARPGPIYSSAHRPFQSYFMTFGSGARLELMCSPGEPARPAHIALSLGSRRAVNALVGQMKAAGTPVVSEPRQTGDGYYEAVVTDSEGNLIEITE